MTLRPNRVVVQNFRSIKHLEIQFEPTCLILLGINESGKSNILRALSMVSTKTKIIDDDVRQLPSDEPDKGESSVEFFFPLGEADQQALATELKQGVLGPDVENIFRFEDDGLTIDELVAQRLKEILYYVDIAAKSRYGRIWRLPAGLSFIGEWVVPTDACPPAHTMPHATLGEIQPRNYWLLHADQVAEDQPPTFFRPATVQDVESRLSVVGRRYVERQLPECVWWSFQNDEALPASVPLDDFLADPASNPALRNMFEIAGFPNPKVAVAEARKRSNGLRTLLERISTKATLYVRSVWDEFAALSLELHENGTSLDCLIRDTYGAYNFQRRSDGFRRFVGFLLQVSARAKAGALKDAILLYDEPDTSLHPSGATQLRDELLRLATTNLVVYSTHSIFMVDPDCLQRHLIVRRQSETTTARKATPATVADEEVLYNAIGHSLFSILREQNILLEGHKDRLLFRSAMELDSKLLAEYANVGICHAGGVRNVAKITPMLELAGRECLVVSDGDKPALDSRREYSGHAAWVTYSELVGPDFVTAEDFLDPRHVRAVLQTLVQHSAPELQWLVRTGITKGPHLMKQVTDVLGTQGIEKTRRNEVVANFKDVLFEDLSADTLLPEALSLVRAVLEKLRASMNQLPNG